MIKGMTLVVSVLTQGCVLQAVDRRLSNMVTGEVVSRDTNKAILFAHSILIGYSGPARIGGDTASWIADTLSSGRDEQESWEALRDGLDAEIARLPSRGGPALLAIDGVGWGIDDAGSLGPRLVRISNYVDMQGQRFESVPPRVQLFSGILKPHVKLNMRAIGQDVPMEIGRFWERTIKHHVQKRAPKEEIGRQLVGFIRQVATGNEAVGSGVLISAIPRGAIEEPSGFVIASMPGQREPTFKYFPEGSAEGIEKGPELANPGGTRMSNFYAERRPDGSEMVQVDIRMPPMP